MDTNSDPDGVDYIIPGNDDAIRAIQVYVNAFADACLEGASGGVMLMNLWKLKRSFRFSRIGAEQVNQGPLFNISL